MRRAICAGTIRVLLACNLVSPGLAQDGEWDHLSRLRPGHRLWIQEAGGRVIEGKFIQSDGDGITVRVGRNSVTARRASLCRIERRERHGRQGAIVGALVGAGIGVAHAAATVETSKLAWTAWLSGFWSAIGAAIGGLNGLSRSSREIVYDAADLVPDCRR